MKTLIISLCIAASALFASGQTCDYNKKGTSQTCTLGGRVTYLHLPPSSCTGNLPIVIYLHGAGAHIWEGESRGLPATADKHCFIEVNAAGSILSTGLESWHIYNDTNNYTGTAPDDVAMLKQVYTDLKAKTAVDSKAVFVLGFSAGAFMAERVAAEGGDVFAAVLAFAGTLDMESPGYGTGLPTTIANPTMINQINGTIDNTVPICGLNNGRIIVDSVDNSLSWWKLKMGCTVETPATSVCVAGKPVLTSKTLSGCASGKTVMWSSMTGVKHNWPSTMNETAWGYFDTHRKP